MNYHMRKKVTLDTKISDLTYQIGILEEVNKYADLHHQPVIMRIIQEKAAEHKALMKISRE